MKTGELPVCMMLHDSCLLAYTLLQPIPTFLQLVVTVLPCSLQYSLYQNNVKLRTEYDILWQTSTNASDACRTLSTVTESDMQTLQ